MPNQEINNGRRLIEEWMPINELSVEAIREGGALAGHPPVNQLHVWWARRPLVVSRSSVAASLLSADADHANFLNALGTSSQIVADRRAMDAVKARGGWSNISFTNDRAFKHNPTDDERQWFKDNLATPDPLVLDITAGGGSIPFEAGRLGLRTHANDLNPVATLILRATCQWPQQFGNDLLEHYDVVRERFQTRVEELLEGVYAEEPLPPDLVEYNKSTKPKSTVGKPSAPKDLTKHIFGRARFPAPHATASFLYLRIGDSTPRAKASEYCPTNRQVSATLR